MLQITNNFRRAALGGRLRLDIGSGRGQKAERGPGRRGDYSNGFRYNGTSYLATIYPQAYILVRYRMFNFFVVENILPIGIIFDSCFFSYVINPGFFYVFNLGFS